MIDVRSSHDVVAVAYCGADAWVSRSMDRGKFSERVIVTDHNFANTFCAPVLRLAAYACEWTDDVSSPNLQMFPGHNCSPMHFVAKKISVFAAVKAYDILLPCIRLIFQAGHKSDMSTNVQHLSFSHIISVRRDAKFMP